MSALTRDYLPEDDDLPDEDGFAEEGGEESDDQGGDAEQMLSLEEIAGKGVDLAFMLGEDVLGRIASQCLESYERDKSERADWEKEYDETLAMVKGQREAKDFPWPGAANVKYPLIMTAALQFGARAYPAIVRGRDVVKTAINGEDPDGQKRAKGNRVAAHMNYQLLEDMPEWEDETDKLVHMLPVHGCVFRQVIWDATYTRPKTSLVSARALVVTQSAKDLETVPIFCKEFELFPHEIIERQRDGRYADVEIKWADDEKSKPDDMLECHCRYDLDDDGYEEPYIAVIHKESGKVLSLKAGFWPSGIEREPDEMSPAVVDPMSGIEIVPAQLIQRGKIVRVRRHVEFIKYGFVPDFAGGFLDLGFGQLLSEHNRIINTSINQLFDAATDQNAGGGFIGQGVNLKGGRLEWEPSEWKFVNVTGGSLRENIVPRPTSQPSSVLFQLLGMMIESGKEVASIRDALTGEVAANQPATTTLAIIEQGLQVFSSIYKRIWRSLGKELSLMFRLNGAYLPEEAYFKVMDSKKAVARADYNPAELDIHPVADPSATTSQQRLAKAEFLNAFKGDPDVDQREIKRRQMEAAGLEDIELLMPQKAPDPMQANVMMLNIRKMVAEIRKLEGDADEKEAGAKLKDIQAKVASMSAMLDAAMTVAEIESISLGAPNGQAAPQAGPVGGPGGGMGGMAGTAPDAPLPVAPPSPFGGDAGGMGAGGLDVAGPGAGQPSGGPGSINRLQADLGSEPANTGGIA